MNAGDLKQGWLYKYLNYLFVFDKIERNAIHCQIYIYNNEKIGNACGFCSLDSIKTIREVSQKDIESFKKLTNNFITILNSTEEFYECW